MLPVVVVPSPKFQVTLPTGVFSRWNTNELQSCTVVAIADGQAYAENDHKKMHKTLSKDLIMISVF
jgi:hypothetical protein